jgi:hypothetical protein
LGGGRTPLTVPGPHHPPPPPAHPPLTKRHNETAPALRRYTLSTLVPPPLAAPVAAFLERLPASICGMSGAGQGLPGAFRREVCPLDTASGAASHSWGYALAEVAMGGADGGRAAKARLDAWLLQACRCGGRGGRSGQGGAPQHAPLPGFYFSIPSGLPFPVGSHSPAP